MIRYSLVRRDGVYAALAHVRETLQFREKIKSLKPLGQSRHSPGVINLGNELIGSISLRLNRDIIPDLFLLITGTITSSGPVSQTEGLFCHELETCDGEVTTLTLMRSYDETIQLLEDLILRGFSLTGRRTEPVLLKLVLEGMNIQSGSFGKEGAPSLPDQAFFYLSGDEISLEGETIPDLAAFSLEGSFSDEVITHTLMIRRKDCVDTNYSMMRRRISASLIIQSREFYEKGQRVRFEISINEAIYQGEESFPDNKGIWGREFNYTIIGPLKVRVFTHLKAKGGSL
ncbi:hypothetical protein EXM22_01870 [Oceanispirochaeta crateris]|uniref:Uncharacterized protein n=1 Tax=Oceanispirochaeta crateris TaxID=2518645 RepID=A0A5C1QH32_9SPIO|nr:hypothetical protein [Oceanispirochaeta crateris]QEN06797.1 hypothetical protein EXM22_01870 [Oceanispirochaeta crateris]